MLPQLDLQWFPSQIFWTLFFFVLIYCFVNFVYMPWARRFIITRRNEVVILGDQFEDINEKMQDIKMEILRKKKLIIILNNKKLQDMKNLTQKEFAEKKEKEDKKFAKMQKITSNNLDVFALNLSKTINPLSRKIINSFYMLWHNQEDKPEALR